jgi:hypothetical protein
MKNYIILFVLVLFSCEAPRDCTDPNCAGSPISFQLWATISDTSSILSVNDTLKMYIPIPDSIKSDYGNYSVGSVNEKRSWFFMQMFIHDSIHADGTSDGEQLVSDVRCLVNGKYQTGSMTFDNKRRMAEIHFFFPRKGKYYIQSNWDGVKFIFKEKEKKGELQAGAYIGLDAENHHHDLYLSWIPVYDHRLQLEQGFRQLKEAGLFWYAFEVK